MNTAGIYGTTTACVVIGDRAEFDRIARPVHDSGVKPDGSHVLYKTVEEGGFEVIFQHWIVAPPPPA